MHKYALSFITTAVDTALRITAVLSFSSFLLQLLTVIPPPAPFPQPDGSICCVSIYFTPQHLWSCPAELSAQTQKLCKRHNSKINILTFRQKVHSVGRIKFQIHVSHKIAENKNYISFISCLTKG